MGKQQFCRLCHHVCLLSCFRHGQLCNLQTVACQATLSIEFSRQEYCLLQGIFQTQELNSCLSCLLHWQVGSLPLMPLEKPMSSHIILNFRIFHYRSCILLDIHTKWRIVLHDQLSLISWIENYANLLFEQLTVIIDFIYFKFTCISLNLKQL